MMLLLNFLPDWIFYALAFAGGVGTVLVMIFGGLIPLPYKLGLQILSAFLLVVGIFFIGGMSNEAEWQLKVKQMEAEIAKKELEAEKISHEVVTKYVDNRIYISKITATASALFDSNDYLVQLRIYVNSIKA